LIEEPFIINFGAKMYISIPQGMIFKKITSNGKTRDCFIDENDFLEPGKSRPVIELQQIVKDFLQNNRGRVKKKEFPQFTIYTKEPPATLDYFLEYTPNNNGKNPTSIEPKAVQGVDAQKYHPENHSRSGTFWYQQTELSAKKLEQVKEDREEERKNRQHIGDSNKPT